MLRAVSVEDCTKPILAGEGASDYERYLRTLTELANEEA
jgi:hypothetical protein